MNDLLTQVIDAHGGLERWAKVRSLTAELELGGPFWALRGWPGVYKDQTVTLDVRREHITFTPFTGPGLTSVLDVNPERVAIVSADGQTVEQRESPRDSFPLPLDVYETKWDAIQIAYFTSAAVWNYLTEPFGFSYPGVQVEEIEPWNENGETWRRLAVTFPLSNANHNPSQIFYYDADFMQRRMDYSPYVTSSPPIAHYTEDFKTFGGFVFPTRRQVHLHGPDGIADRSLAIITMDIHFMKAEILS